MLREKLSHLVRRDADVSQPKPVAGRVLRPRAERVKHKHTAGARQSRQILCIARASGFVNRVQTADVEDEIEWLTQEIEARDIGDMKINRAVRAFCFCARGGNRLCREIHADDGEPVLREVNRIRAGAAAEVERASPRRTAFDKRNDLGRCDAAVPGRTGETILQIEKESA